MTLNESTIYIKLKKLRKKLYNAQFLMDKSVRVVYGVRIMEKCSETIENFVMSFELKENKLHYAMLAIAKFAVLRTDLEFVNDENLIHYTKNKNISNDEHEKWVSSKQIELFILVAEIDDEMNKWKENLAKRREIIIDKKI